MAHCLNPEKDFYFLPGGGVWFQKKIEDYLVREVKEEAGLDIKAERLLWVRDFIEGFPNLHGIEIFFLATIQEANYARNECMILNRSNSRL